MNIRLLLPGLRRMKRRPIQTLMFAAGIALGSFLYSMTTVVNKTADISLEKGIEVVAGKTDLVITQNEFGFPEEILEKVRMVEDIDMAVPLVKSRVIFKNSEGKDESLMVFGVDLFIESSIRSYNKSSRNVVKDPLEFMSQPDSIAVPFMFASRNGFKLGSKFDLMTTQGLKTFTIRSIIEGKEIGESFGSGFGVMDIEAARLAFGKVGKLDRIDLHINDESELREVVKNLKETVGDSFDVDVPFGQVDVFKKSVTTFQKMTSFLSALVFFVAFCLVVISVTHSVIDRKMEVGILRSLGMTRGQIFSILFSENTVLAVCGSFFGVVMCFVVSHLLAERAQEALSVMLGTPLTLSGFKWGIWSICYFTFSGFVVVSSAAFYPILKLTKIPVLEAIRQSGSEDMKLKKLRLPLYLGLLFLSISLVLQVINHFSSSSVGASYQTGLIFFSSILIGPWLVLQILSLIDFFVRDSLSAQYRLALSHASRGHRSTQLIVIGLIFGMIILTIISIVSSSFLDAVDARMSDSASPNIYVSSNGSLITNQLQPLDYSLRDKIIEIPGAEGTYGQRITRIRYKNHSINIRAVEEVPPINFKRPYSYLNVTDRPAEKAGYELYHKTGLPIMVNETFVQMFELKTGDRLMVETAKGAVEAVIVGVISDLFGGGGSFFLSLDKYRTYWDDPLVSGFGVFVKPGEDVEKIRTMISERFGTMGMIASTRADVGREGHKVIQKGFSYLKFIEYILATVALLGFVNTFLIVVLSRLKTIATIRAIGMTSSEVFRAILFEGALIGFVGIGISITLGWIVSHHFLAFSLGPQYGWIVPQVTDWFSLLSSGFVIFLIVIFISLYPALRASKQGITNALSAE